MSRRSRAGRVRTSLVIQFRGAIGPGEYRATLRIVTQARKAGMRSVALPGEPPISLRYLDIPIRVRVSQLGL